MKRVCGLCVQNYKNGYDWPLRLCLTSFIPESILTNYALNMNFITLYALIYVLY